MGPAGLSRSGRLPGFILTWSGSPKGLNSSVSGFKNQRRQKTCPGKSTVPQATRAGCRLWIAHCTPSAMRWVTNRWYSVNSFSGLSGFAHRALTDEWVWVQDMSM